MVFQDTHNYLSNLALQYDDALVSFSGGKDSLVVLDLATRYFKKVKCFFMYLVDDLSINNEQLEKGLSKYPDVELIKYPHWINFTFKKDGVYCRPIDVDKIKLIDIYRQAQEDSKIDLIFTGAKKSDSIWRRQYQASLGNDYNNVKVPIWEWNQYDVIAYLKSKNIEIPHSSQASNSGIDLVKKNIRFYYENYYNDFKKIEKEYPFIRASIKQEEFYGKN